MHITKQLQQEIEEIRDKVLFYTYHSSNLDEQHILVDTNALRQKLRMLPVYGDEICMYSHFFGCADDVLPLIQTCVQQNLQYLEKWNPSNTALVLHSNFPKPIGTGIVKGTDWDTLFPMSRIRVILEKSKISGRTFRIATAYPVPNMEEMDAIWDAMDAFSAQQVKKSR
ncbi:hypothetical protein NE634_14675 [Lacrimispora saccharolytica]|nr:hypothetical protein [Lacrimispora saccharolytica]